MDTHTCFNLKCMWCGALCVILCTFVDIYRERERERESNHCAAASQDLWSQSLASKSSHTMLCWFCFLNMKRLFYMLDEIKIIFYIDLKGHLEL